MQPSSFICRSCRHALRQLPSTQSQQLRPFSSSRQNAKSLATFAPTSSPELDTILSSWRRDVFLPSVLSRHHKDLIYKKSRHDLLTQAPGVTVTVRTLPPPSTQDALGPPEEIKLEPANQFDQPGKQSFKKIIQALENDSSPAAWDNIIPFLEGLRIAKLAYPSLFVTQLARKANIQGKERWKTIILAAQLGKRTRVTLASTELTTELVIGAFYRAMEQQFKTSEPRNTMQQILLMLDSEDHCGGNIEALDSVGTKDMFTDMRQDPIVIAAKLAFSSAKALNVQKGKDGDGAVASDLQKLLALAEKIPHSLGSSASLRRFGSSKQEFAIIGTQNLELQDLSIVYGALALADKVDFMPSLGRENNIKVSSQIQAELRRLQERIAIVKKEVETNAKGARRRSLAILQAVEAALKKM